MALLMLGACLWGCSPGRLFEGHHELPGSVWLNSDRPVFEFDITDTSLVYNISCTVRSTGQYPFYNLYVSRTLLSPTGHGMERRLDEFTLADPATGRPTGSRAGAGYSHRVLSLKNLHFAAPGRYGVQLQPYMRQDSLPGLLSVGVVVEAGAEPTQP